jgi:hypothetical protein
MTNSKINDELFEVMLRNAVSEDFDSEYEQMSAEAKKMEEPSYSAEFAKNMEGLYARESRSIAVKKLVKVGKRVAVVILALVILTTALYMNVEAFRIKLFNMIFDSNQDRISINIINDDVLNKQLQKNIPENWEGAYIATYLPKNYRLDFIKYHSKILLISYTNDDKTIIFKQKPATDATQEVYANDGEVIFVGDYEGRIYLSNGYYTLIWQNNSIHFEIYSNEKKEIIINIAKNLKYVKKV